MTLVYILLNYLFKQREHSIAMNNYAILSKNDFYGLPSAESDYNAEKDVFFIIDGFNANNKPVSIKTPNQQLVLAFDTEKNTAVFKTTPEPNDLWIIEQEGDDYYIKTLHETPYHNRYLGSPNKNRKGFLYTSKNRFTKWRIIPIKDNIYEIRYVGMDFDKTDITIAIARYSEDVKWAKPYNDAVIIYNKGENTGSLGFDTIVELTNEGREGETFLHHIIENYHNLAKTTIFAQGNPFDHNDTLLFGIDNYFKNQSVQALTNRYNTTIPPPEFVNQHKTATDYGLEYLIFKVDGNLMCKSGFADWGMNNVNELYRGAFKHNKDITLMEGYLKDAEFSYTHKPDFFQGENVNIFLSAVFSVTRDKILNNDIESYKRLRTVLLNHTVCGYILERLWLFILEPSSR
jgi:hypothetical protein